MTHTTSRQLEVVSVVDALADDLERRVLEGEFAPGEHLREVELAEEYRVGRHTLRAAFDGLIRRGVLERARNRGVFVRVLTAQDIPDIYELRTALEVQAFRTLAARRTVPPEATEALARLRALKTRSPRHEVVAADLGFHRAIVAGTGNRCLVRAHEDLHSETLLSLSQLVTRYANVRQLADEHADLLALIESGRPARAEAAIRDHLERATAWLVEHAAGPEPAAQIV